MSNFTFRLAAFKRCSTLTSANNLNSLRTRQLSRSCSSSSTSGGREKEELQKQLDQANERIEKMQRMLLEQGIDSDSASRDRGGRSRARLPARLPAAYTTKYETPSNRLRKINKIDPNILNEKDIYKVAELIVEIAELMAQDPNSDQPLQLLAQDTGYSDRDTGGSGGSDSDSEAVEPLRPHRTPLEGRVRRRRAKPIGEGARGRTNKVATGWDAESV